MKQRGLVLLGLIGTVLGSGLMFQNCQKMAPSEAVVSSTQATSSGEEPTDGPQSPPVGPPTTTPPMSPGRPETSLPAAYRGRWFSACRRFNPTTQVQDEYHFSDSGNVQIFKRFFSDLCGVSNEEYVFEGAFTYENTKVSFEARNVSQRFARQVDIDTMNASRFCGITWMVNVPADVRNKVCAAPAIRVSNASVSLEFGFLNLSGTFLSRNK